MRRTLLFLGLAALLPATAFGQSAGEVERCFQNPGACATGGGAAIEDIPLGLDSDEEAVL